ncbi:hypothetical protein ACWEQL_18875 [Kitasatospora sp. NPDC004240]
MSSKRLLSTAVICLALAAGTTACGDKGGSTAAGTPAAAPTSAKPTLDTEKLTAEEIEQKAKDALASAKSVRIKGEITMEEEGTIKIDVALDTKGQCTGSMTMAGLGSFEMISDGTQTWVKPDESFWNGIDEKGAAAELFKGRYLSGVNDDPQMKQMASVCNLTEFTKQITEPGSSEKVTKGTAGTVNGLKTFSLNMVDEDGQPGVLHVATEGAFYPVRIEQTGGKEPGKVDFTDYDKPVEVKAPAPENVVDVSKLKSQFPNAV